MPRRKRKGPVRRTVHSWQQVLIKAEPEDLDSDENHELKENEDVDHVTEAGSGSFRIAETNTTEMQTTASLNGDSPQCEGSTEAVPDSKNDLQSSATPPHPRMMSLKLPHKEASQITQTASAASGIAEESIPSEMPRRKSKGPMRRSAYQTADNREFTSDASSTNPSTLLQSETNTSHNNNSLEEDVSQTPPHPTLMFVKLPRQGASQIISKSIPDKDEVIPETDDDNLLDVTCGELHGRLHKNKFYCPGIHKECIEFDGHMMTPKQFAYLGGKANLKDWKNAIRVGGMKLRKYIDAGYLQFYQHDQFCTFRCAGSVIPNNPSQRIIKPDVPLQVTAVTTIKEHTYSFLPDHSEGRSLKRGGLLGDGQETTEDNPSKRLKVASNEISSSDIEDHIFWKGIVDLGLADEFFREIKSSLDGLKNSMIRKFVPMAEAKVLTKVVTKLGLMNKLKHRLAAHKFEMERQQHKLDREMEELKKRVTEYEHKKEMLKKKSECFDNLMVMSQVKKDKTASLPASPKPADGKNVIMVIGGTPKEGTNSESAQNSPKTRIGDKLMLISEVKTVQSDTDGSSSQPLKKSSGSVENTDSQNASSDSAQLKQSDTQKTGDGKMVGSKYEAASPQSSKTSLCSVDNTDSKHTPSMTNTSEGERSNTEQTVDSSLVDNPETDSSPVSTHSES